MVKDHKTEIVIRYAETDQMGSVHHASYVVYLEAARVEHLKAIGLPYHELEKRGAMLPVIELSVRYVKPAKFGQTLTVVSRILPLEGIRLKVEYQVYHGKELMTTGYTLHAFVNRDGRPIRPPDDVSVLLSQR